jgi:succinoglycan biosynthesis protein ExoA
MALKGSEGTIGAMTLPGAQPEVLSVIVPCRNEVSHIEPFIEGVLRQELPSPWITEILIADGLSDDGTQPILEARAKADSRVRLIPNPGRIVSTGLNLAIQAASGSVIARMDVHTRYAEDYLSKCLEALLETDADNVGGPWVAEGKGYVSSCIALAFASRVAMGGARGHLKEYRGPVDTVYLGCWRREVFVRVGLFDESLVRNQDDEFNLRITRNGGVVYQSPAIVSRYVPRESWWALWRQYCQYGYWKVGVLRRHGTPASLRHLVPGAFVLMLLTGWIPGLWSQWLLMAYFIIIATYVAAIGGVACILAKQKPRLLPGLLVAIPSMHFAYGLGWMYGCLHVLFGRFGCTPSMQRLSR